jgi:hypothetical protein
LNLVTLGLQVMQDLTGSAELLVRNLDWQGADGKVDILQMQVGITACADSLATFGVLVGDIVSGMTGPKPYMPYFYDDIGLMCRPPPEMVQSPTALDHSVDVFGM